MKEELLKGLSEEQIAKFKNCSNTEEALVLAKEEGIELTDEQLEAVSGGSCFSSSLTCPKCGYDGQHNAIDANNKTYIYCGKCGSLIKVE